MEAMNKIRAWKNKISQVTAKARGLFVRKSEVSEKHEINWSSFKLIGFATIILFVAIVLLLPNEQTVEFAARTDPPKESTDTDTDSADPNTTGQDHDHQKRRTALGSAKDYRTIGRESRDQLQHVDGSGFKKWQCQNPTSRRPTTCFTSFG